MVLERLLRIMSYTEIKAANALYDALEGEDGVVVASNIADVRKCSRSLLVGTQRLLEAAGVIETKSLGRYGTHIKILDHETFEGVSTYRNYK